MQRLVVAGARRRSLINGAPRGPETGTRLSGALVWNSGGPSSFSSVGVGWTAWEKPQQLNCVLDVLGLIGLEMEPFGF